jgi:hypothetical protein
MKTLNLKISTILFLLVYQSLIYHWNKNIGSEKENFIIYLDHNCIEKPRTLINCPIDQLECFGFIPLLEPFEYKLKLFEEISNRGLAYSLFL